MSHYSPIVAAIVTMLLTTVILFSKFGKEVQDIPNERSLHDTPIPRIGGVAMMAGILSGWALMLDSWAWWLVLPLIGLFVVSLLDDMHSLPVKKRLLAQLAGSIDVLGQATPLAWWCAIYSGLLMWIGRCWRLHRVKLEKTNVA